MSTSDRQPLVSVILPTCNRPGLLRKALESIRSQVYRAFEVVVCNDGETGIDEVLSDYEGTFPLVVPSKKPRCGLAASRNIGIDHSHGDLIAYLDDDDIYYPDHLSSLVHHLQEQNASFVYSDAYRSFWRSRETDREPVTRDIPYSCDVDRSMLLVRNCLPVLSVLHDRHCLESAGCFDEELKTHEDWDLWIRISRTFDMFHLRHITCEFTVPLDGGSMTAERRDDFLDSLDRIYERYQAFVQGDPAIRRSQRAMRRKVLLQLRTPWLTKFKSLYHAYISRRQPSAY